MTKLCGMSSLDIATSSRDGDLIGHRVKAVMSLKLKLEFLCRHYDDEVSDSVEKMVDLLLKHHGYEPELVIAIDLKKQLKRVLKDKSNVTLSLKKINGDHYVEISTAGKTVFVGAYDGGYEVHEEGARSSSYFDDMDEALMEAWKMV